MGSVGPLGVFTPSGLPRAGTVVRIAPPAGPPCAFASLQRPIATPPHRRGDPEGPTRPTMLPSLDFPAPRHVPERGTRDPQSLPALRRAACEVWVPPSRRPPPSLRAPLRGPSVHGLRASRRSPRAGRTPSREPLPSCRLARRFASLLKVRADASGFRASIPASSSFGPPRPRGHGASMPPCDSSLQSVLPHRPVERFGSRSLPHHALGGMTSRPACVSRSCGAIGVVGPSRGYRLSWDLPPCDRRGTARNARRAGSWIRLAGGGDSVPGPALSPLVTFRPRPRGSRPGAAVLR